MRIEFDNKHNKGGSNCKKTQKTIHNKTNRNKKNKNQI